MILVDFPPLKRGSAGGLSYLREEEWTETVVDQFRVDSVESSPVWEAVAESGYAAVGRLRVFCEPRYAPVIQHAVDTAEFDRLVAKAIDAHDN